MFIGYEPWSSSCFEIVLLIKWLNSKIKIIVYTCENILRKYPLPFRWLEKYVLKKVDLILTITQKEGEIILRKKGYLGSVEHLPLSVDMEIFFKKDVREIRKKYFGDDKIIIGFVGRLVKEKGVYVLLESLKLLSEKFCLIVVGEGVEKDNFIKFVEKSGLKERVIFLNSVEHKKLVDYINCFDVLVLPSITTKNWKEQFGRVLIEAMSCRVPVIGSSSGEIPNVINDCGIIFEENDFYDLKNKIEILFKDDVLRNELVEKAFSRVKICYSRKVIEKQMEEIYKKIIK